MKKVSSICTVGVIVLGLFSAFKLATLERPPAPDVFKSISFKKSDKNMQAVPPQLENVRSIVCIGDSITRYGVEPNSSFPRRLEAYLAAILPEQGIKVLNKGIDGEHSDDLRKRFSKDAIKSGANLVIIFVGVNDVGHGFTPNSPDGGGPEGVEISKYLDNVKAMIKDAKANSQSVLLVTPPTFFEDASCKPDMMLETYAEGLRKLALEEKVMLADVRKSFVELIKAYRTNCDAKDFLLTVDGVHPNSLGNKVITETILSSLGIDANSRDEVRHQ
ncbi:MAG: GDSL-type esterase/lipase family protein [Candidatus Melainabacteria bacterium]|nr:GDSL-type esterase/lipase family protein [Candidatus Melainabacteria bacterium]